MGPGKPSALQVELLKRLVNEFPLDSYICIITILYRWLEHVDDAMATDEDTKTSNISWSAFHAKNQKTEREVDISVMLPLFRECSKSVAMIRHTMDVVKQAVDHVNPGQTPVIAYDQPLYTLAKQIQWNWPDVYGEEKFVIMMGALHIEMAALKTLGMYDS